MPRYFFHVYNDEVSFDDEGCDLADPAAAREHAVQGARPVMGDQLRDGRLRLADRIEVEVEQGRVFTVTFGDAVRIEG